MEEELETIELFVDSEGDGGINAISFVEFPAIEENFIALNEHKVEMKTVDEDKRLVVGLALIPNKLIYRKNRGFEYNITFSEETVRKASEKYLKSLKLHNTTVAHETEVDGVFLTESWIVEDPEKDKTALYGLNATKGSWAVSMRIENDDLWDRIKKGDYLGFSIEGMFSEEEKLSSEEMDILYEIETLVDLYEDYDLESYSDYPKGARNNAKRALAWKKENGSSCGTSVGWTRASQLASGSNISRSTIARMASFKRHQQHKDVPYSEGCGGIMWDAWGGSAGVNWAISKLKQIDKK